MLSGTVLYADRSPPVFCTYKYFIGRFTKKNLIFGRMRVVQLES